MKCCVQRVSSCSVVIDNEVYSKINNGLLVLVGIEKGDKTLSCEWLANKVCGLRIFTDDSGKMSLDLDAVNGELCIVSQFTLAGNIKKGKRPDFTAAMHPDVAKPMVEYFVEECRNRLGEGRVKTGVFAANMKLHIVNDGPVTILMEH